MSQAVTPVANLPSVTATDSSSNSSVYAATTSTVTTISPCPMQQYSPPQSSVPSQYSQLPVYASEGFQPKIKLLTRPQTANGTPDNEIPLNHQATMMEPLTSSASNVVVGVSSATGMPVMAPTLSSEDSNEWQPPVTLVMPSERCDDENPSVNLQEFLFNTMRSPQDNRDRVFLLQLESMFTSYINDPLQTAPFTLPPDTSYHRMLAHRVAAYFGLKHSVDPTGNSVVVWKIAESKVPEQRFEDYIPVEEKDSLEPKKQILKRSKEIVAPSGPSQKLEQQPSGITNADMKSIEEKQEAYDRAKARIFSQEPSTSQPRNGSRQQQQTLLSDPVVEITSNTGNSTEHNDVGKFQPEGDSRDDTSPGSRSRSSSQGSNNMSTNRTTPSRNRSSNRRQPQAKYSSRQPYIQTGYVPSLATQSVNPGMLYYQQQQQQQQQQAAMLQQYTAAAAGYPQYLQYAHNPMMSAAAAALYSQPSVNSYTFQPQPQQLYAMPGGQVYSVLPNPAMRPPAMYMHSQQQGSFHHPHLQPTGAGAAAGIIRPVPQHAQPQANRFVSKPVHVSGNSWKPTFAQQQMAATATQQLRVNNNSNTATVAAAGNIQEYQLANYIESNLTLTDEASQETESPEHQQQPTTSSSQKLTQLAATAQYTISQEQDVQNPSTAPESVAAIKFFPHMTSSGQVQYIATASPMINSHGYQNQFANIAVTAANPYSYQLQNAPSTPPINMINPSQPVLFSPPSSGPPTPSHYIPQGLFSPPPQPAILVGMGTQQTNPQLSNLVTQQNSAEALTQTRLPEESSERNGNVVETNALGSQTADSISTAKTVVSASNSIEVVQKRPALNNQQQEVSAVATVTTNATTTTTATNTANKHKELDTSNTYTSSELPPRFQQRNSGSTTRYQNQRHPSNRPSTKQVTMDATNVAITTNHYGPLSTAMPKREPLLPTPPTVACIIPHEPMHSGGQDSGILEIINFPAEGPQYQAALVELKKLHASILNIKKVNGAAIFVAKFESAHQAKLAMQQTTKQQQPYQLVVPTGQHSKIIHTALSRRQQSANRTS